ncbi:hypothetical protein ACFLYM_02285 [Chloroflexota bacterium]
MVIIPTVKTGGYVLMALLIVCFVPVTIWVAAGSTLYQSRKRRLSARDNEASLICSLNTDCPLGYICVDGYCVSEQPV